MLLSIQAFFSWICIRCVSKSAVGPSSAFSDDATSTLPYFKRLRLNSKFITLKLIIPFTKRQKINKEIKITNHKNITRKAVKERDRGIV